MTRDSGRRPSLLGRIVGGNAMPTYIPQVRGDRKFELFTREDKRKFWFFQEIPFYNGSDISFILRLTMPKRKDISEDFGYSWALYKEGSDVPVRSAPERTVLLANHRTTRLGIFPTFNTGRGIGYVQDGKYSVFFVKDAIKVGRMSLFETGTKYQLRLRLASIAVDSEEMTVSEFTLQNRDDILGSTIVNLILSSLFGIVAGFIGAMLAIAFFGR